MIASDMRFWRQLVDLMPIDSPPRLISEYVQDRRIMPTDSPFPGYWNNSRTPYLVEIMDDMSPYSPIQVSVTMKSRKLGVTAAAENVVCYWMDANPTRVKYTTATDELAEDWATKRLEPAIDSLGFRHKMIATVNAPKARRSGDKVFSKTYVGGSISIISAGSMMARRSGDDRVLVVDEIDGVKILTTTGEGNWLEILKGHTMSWGARKKIMLFSSPATLENSNIDREYELGDCRKFLVPCPRCGAMQELVDDQENYGLKGDFEAGEFKRAYYLCIRCGEAVFNHQKTKMLAGGRWEPTKRSSDPVVRSRQISALYSPVGMFSWDEYYRKMIATQGDPDALRSFQTLYRGLPYLETGARPDLRRVILLRGTYKQGEVRPDVAYLTAAIDVQRGKDKPEGPDEGPRLEMEVLGHGRGYRTWSIDFRKFYGPIDDPYSGAWEKLNQWAAAAGLAYRRSNGSQVAPAIIMIDSADGNVTDIVYAFCARWRNTFPCKGTKLIKADREKRETGDIAGTAYKRWRAVTIDPTLTLYEINTQFYKQQLYAKLNTVMRQASEPQPNGFQDFPIDYPDTYFEQLTAEEQRADGSFHKIRERNEALDVRVYNMAAGDIYLMSVVDMLRRTAKERGATLKQLEAIGSKEALDVLSARISG